MNITMKMKANIRKVDTTKKATRKKDTRRRAAQKRDTSMKTTRDTSTRRDMNPTTLTTKSTARREANMEKAPTDSSTEAKMMVITKNFFVNCFKEAFMCLIVIQLYFHNTKSVK